MIEFKGTAEASMRNAIEQLAAAAADPSESAQDAAFQDAMLSIINLAVVMHRGDRPPQLELAEFRQRVSDLLTSGKNPGNLGAYIADGDSYASRAVQSGAYYEAALVRTVAQLLLDDYPDAPEVFDEYDHDDLNDIDEALREAAEQVPPLNEAGIPDGMPDSHWWWSAPHGDPEAYALLHGRDDEDL